GGVRAVVAESVLMKHQLLIVNRSRQRAPNLRVLDRLVPGFCSLSIKSTRVHGELLIRPTFPRLIEVDTMPHARHLRSVPPCDRHVDAIGKTGWRPFRRCRIRTRETSTVDPHAFTETSAQSACLGSDHRRFMRRFDLSGTCGSFRNHPEAVHSPSVPPCVGSTKISTSVFA